MNDEPISCCLCGGTTEHDRECIEFRERYSRSVTVMYLDKARAWLMLDGDGRYWMFQLFLPRPSWATE
jgi:hypothetical protein